jgi:hypothetical protein
METSPLHLISDMFGQRAASVRVDHALDRFFACRSSGTADEGEGTDEA